QNPWLEAQGKFAPYQVFHDDQILPREEAQRSPFYTEWLAPQGDFGASTGVVVLREGARQLVIEIRYPESRQGQVRERAASILGETAYHLGRAIEISGRSRFSAGRGYLDSVVAEL